MGSPEARRRLIVNADDFGRSHAINQAVIRAHREGILTTASLMVNESAADEAVALARENPDLGVGLHLVPGLRTLRAAPVRHPQPCQRPIRILQRSRRRRLPLFFLHPMPNAIAR